MKKISMLFAAFMMAFSCTTTVQEEQLQTGDLVFVGLPMDYSLDNDGDTMDSAIVAATGDDDLNMIHVAIAEVEDGEVWIIDATIKHGVDRHPLSVFLEDFTLKDGSYPEFIVKRLSDNSDASQWVENAKKYLGAPYDVAFQPADSAYYCSELVEASYLSEDGESLFHNAPMNFKNSDGEFPVYWEQLFARINSTIPQGKPGTNPQAMSKEDCLVPVEGVDITAIQ